jgi:hypothetical protein
MRNATLCTFERKNCAKCAFQNEEESAVDNGPSCNYYLVRAYSAAAYLELHLDCVFLCKGLFR